MHLRFILENTDTPFIHFSSAPCPDKYETEGDKNFHTLGKDYSSNLIGLIKDVMELEGE